MPELIPIEINSGFNNCEYLEVNGRAEPNTTNKRTTIASTTGKYDNVCPLRGDTMGILTNLATPIDTKDTKSDSGIFIIKTQGKGVNWKPEKNENIQINDGSSIFGEELLNRYFTPTRMLIRHANKIKSGLRKFPGSFLRFQTSDKLQTLKTTGEGFTISENQDIAVSDLANPIYKPMKHTVECAFTFKDLEMLQDSVDGYPNIFRWIKFSETVSCYILNLKKTNDEDKAEITIIEKA